MISDIYDNEQIEQLKSTEFYQRFGKHKIIEDAFVEVDLMEER